MAEATQQRAQVQPAASVRQGSRWLHAMPTGEDVAEWFTEQPLHDGMDHSRYLGGIVLIPAKEKVPTTRVSPSGQAMLGEIERQVFVPYVRVDTRVAYFWDLVRTWGREDYDDVRALIGVIEPVPQKRITDRQSPYYNEHLPEGFFLMPVRNGEKTSQYLGARWRVAIYERQSYAQRVNGAKPMPLLQGIGTKQTTMVRTYPDDNALMKAETGAIGRALGVAGILVVGSGIATAEDMLEDRGSTPGAGASAEPTLPEIAAPAAAQPASAAPSAAASDAPEGDQATLVIGPEEADAQLREQASALGAEMQRDYPEAWEQYKAWWEERKLPPLAQIKGPVLRGAVVKLQRDLDQAKTTEV